MAARGHESRARAAGDAWSGGNRRALERFLARRGWKVLYGLNLGTGTAERAAEEAELVTNLLGDRLLAFQVGNEADLYGPTFREGSWNFERYWSEYQRFR